MAALNSWDVAQALLDCAFNGVDHVAPWEIKRHCIVPGEIAWDDCECGQLAVAEVRRFPSNMFPLEQVDHTAECGAPYLVVAYNISLARCAPTVNENGKAPTCAKLQASAHQLNKDMGDIRRAIECCLNVHYDSHAIVAYELGAQEITGPQGRCIETTLAVLVAFANGCGCG